ncbi:FAD-dependent oxidoreductase [Sediminicoccus sp. KRV36]|uniref:NAD(P)/FAD-dependent oxidoreductase n=1 Tax=Sediminicoccus sp. KRV36 TaxID=3133721 RepID=UPI0020101281|nr:FAD-dependent oxidoreductase [Sediminicoccus rosea]UPY36253.1 FAD-dependent oxidoreductase [Sediminicoccus rosea]
MSLHVLVIGAGPAGTRCAVRSAERGARVTLCGAEAALPYDRVALSSLLAGEKTLPDLITHDLAALQAQGIAFRPATPITALDCAASEAVTARGERIGYDRVVIATGSRAIRLPVPGADLPGVLTYRTLDDVRAMLRAARAGGSAVVVGGGLLGLEAAAGLAQRGMKVTVLHPVEWPMERQLDAGAGGFLARRMGLRGIRFAMPAQLAAIEGEGRVTGVVLADGKRIAANIVVMAVGIRPDTALAAASGLSIGRGIQADAGMRSSDPNILAIGECAEVEGRTIGLVAPALEQAEIAAATLAGAAAQYAPRADQAALKVSGTAVWSAGDIEGEGVTLRDEEEDRYRRLFLREDRLVGAVLYGDVSDSGFYLNLIASRRPIGRLRAALALGPAFLPELA